MKISILGAGRWGSTLAWAQAQAKRQVILWNRQDEFLVDLQKDRRNKYLKLPANVDITADLEKALASKVIFISIRCQNFREFCFQLSEYKPKGKLFILAMKGLEEKTGKLLSEIFEEYLPGNTIGMLAGPGHPQELTKNIPTVMTVATRKNKDLELAVKFCQTDLIKILPSRDLTGVEIGAAVKNIMGIGGGILTAIGAQSLKSYLITRGPLETGRLIKAMGGRPQTAFGLSHLGDYSATVFSGYSYNHQAGEMWVKKKKLAANAEGVPTVRAVKLLMNKYKVKMPICEQIYKILYEKAAPETMISGLLKIKKEFDAE